MMRGASRDALVAVRRHTEEAAGPKPTVDSLKELAGDLHAVAGLLYAQSRLRRTLADAATDPDSRAELIGNLLAGQVSEPARQVTQAAVRERWSSPWDLGDALELAGDDGLLAAAELTGDLDRVEDELFRCERLLDRESELSAILDENTASATRRIDMLRTLLGEKVHPITLQLLENAVASRRKHTVTFAIDDLLEFAAARRERSVARVVSAVELTDEQQTRLATALSNIYGRPIYVRAAVDPSVLGGAIIRVGGERIDGSIAARLSNARAALSG